VEPSEEIQHVALGQTGLTLHVPPGSINEPVSLDVRTLDVSSSATLATDAFGERRLAGALDLSPSGISLAGPIFVEVPAVAPEGFDELQDGEVRMVPLPAYWRQDSDQPWIPEDFASTSAENDGMSFLRIERNQGALGASVLLGLDHFSQHGYVIPPLEADPTFGWGELFTPKSVGTFSILVPGLNYSDTFLHDLTLNSPEIRENLYYDQLRELIIQTTRQRAKLWGNAATLTAALVDEVCPGCTTAQRIDKLRKQIQDQVEATSALLAKLKAAKKAFELALAYQKSLTKLGGLIGEVGEKAKKAGKKPSLGLWSCLADGAFEVAVYATLDQTLVRERWRSVSPQVTQSPLYKVDPAYAAAVTRLSDDLRLEDAIDAFRGSLSAIVTGSVNSCSEALAKAGIKLVSKAVLTKVVALGGLTGIGATAFPAAAGYLVVDFAKQDLWNATVGAQRLSGLGTLLVYGGLTADITSSQYLKHAAKDGAIMVEVPATIDAYDAEAVDFHRVQVRTYALEQVARSVAKSLYDVQTVGETEVGTSSGSWISKGLNVVGDIAATLGGRTGSRADVAGSYSAKASQYKAVLDAIDEAMGACGVLPCDFACVDADHDGYGSGPGCVAADCDDSAPARTVRRTCASAGADCGVLDDDCGGTVDCGSCSSGQTCGAGGVENHCGPCEDGCSGAGAFRCSAAQVSECLADADGCLAWSAPSPCESGECADGTSCAPAACQGAGCQACQDACSTLDVTECSAGQLTRCVEGVEGCLTWGTPSACASGQCADATSCDSCGDGSCEGTENDSTCPADCSCTPASCDSLNGACGVHDDGCGGSVDCGSCDPDDPDAVIEVSAGQSGTCALHFGGSVHCWGRGDVGQLGNGATSHSSVPVRVSNLDDATSISVGAAHTCATLATGNVSCWGYGGSGQLGNGSTSDSSVPVTVSGLDDAVSVSAGNVHSCAVRASGQVSCWGTGALGDDANTNSSVPVDVVGLGDAVAVSAGFTRTCAVRSSGEVVCWGSGNNGELGTGAPLAFSSTPVAVANLNDAVAVRTGNGFACALRASGTVACWGYGFYGSLGNGLTATQYAPVAVSNLSNATSLAASESATHACAARADGTVACWGMGRDGQLGNGMIPKSMVPVSVSSLSNAEAVVVGATHSCALRTSGQISCWGSSTFGQLGNGVAPRTSLPVPASTLVDVQKLSAGYTHACAQHSGGTVSCWGTATLGNNTTAPSGVPVPVSNLTDAVSIGTGQGFSCGLRSTGSVMCWGSGGNGQLGNGSTGERVVPVTVSNLTDAVALSAGQLHACAARAAGGAVCWGSGMFGQLGNAGTADSSVPVPVANLTDVVSISAGFTHTCALRATGAVACWGQRQLGDGVTTSSSVPVTVSNLSDAVTVSANGNHTCALRSTGEVVCWGFGGAGSLGNGDTLDANLPVAVSNLSDAVELSVGWGQTCAVRATGGVVCWGQGDSGQLGAGDTVSSSVPVEVSNLTGAISVGAGLNYSCAVTASGGVLCWGDGAGGQLGDGRPWWLTPELVQLP
jgi:alpha-tubulin suppressor-like RCC1 family protein